MTFLQLQSGTFSIAGAGASIGDTSVVLKSFKDINGVNITMADLGDISYITMEPGNGTLEEQISFTGVTQNANGTATLTGVKTVLFKSPYTETSGLAKTHAGSTSCILSNTAGYYQQFVHRANAETITGIKTFATGATPLVTDNPTTDTMVANKLYVDTVTTAGAPDASNTTKGITKLSVAAVSPTSPIAVGDNDGRVPTQGENDALAGTSGTPSSTNKYVTNDDTSDAAASAKIVRATGTALPALSAANLINVSITKSLTAGETINGATLPVPVYIDASTNKIFACDGNVGTKLEFIGFAITNSTDTNPITVRFHGIVGGFTGLTAGAKYYVQDTVGTIGTTIGTMEIYVGIATSTTEILIDRGTNAADQYIGTQSLSNGANTITAGFQSTWRTVIINLVDDVGTAGDITLKKVGKSTGAIRSYNAGVTFGANAVFNGTNIITVGKTDSSNSASGNAYYYR